FHVTGVQTCALPISAPLMRPSRSVRVARTLPSCALPGERAPHPLLQRLVLWLDGDDACAARDRGGEATTQLIGVAYLDVVHDAALDRAVGRARTGVEGCGEAVARGGQPHAVAG